MNKKVVLKPLLHRGQENIALQYNHDLPLNNIVRKLPGIKWSQNNKCWYVPLSKENYNIISHALHGFADIERSALRQYLEQKKKKEPVAKQLTHDELLPSYTTGSALLHSKNEAIVYKTERVHEINGHVLPLMKQQLKLKAYSPSTIKTYLGEMAQLLQLLKDIPADDLKPEHMKRYLVYCYEKLKLTENTLHSRINAMKFYYEQVLKREKFFWEIPRPKKALQLPKVLSKEEIALLLKAIVNLKHKTMLMLGYGCGLRVSEITGLQITDIDENRRLLFIRRAKGKKDRVINLSPALLVILREYCSKYEPKYYLFEGQEAGTAYSVRSLEQIIHAAKEKAGIKKAGSIHMLRHSFATHLLDKGTDVIFIQKLLGHNDIKTTLRYLHVTNKDILNILSPIEDIKDLLE